ncbi:MAG: IclR family transcriptional regulator, partial [Geminicoccaceae bacterium]
PFHCTASGKVFLASTPLPLRRIMVESLQLEKYTARTLRKRSELMEELEQIENQGFALDQGEFIDGMVAIAVPIRSIEGQYMASLALHGPSQRLSIESVVSKKGSLLKAAEKINKVWLT